MLSFVLGQRDVIVKVEDTGPGISPDFKCQVKSRISAENNGGEAAVTSAVGAKAQLAANLAAVALRSCL